MAFSKVFLSAVAGLLLGAALCSAAKQGPCDLSLDLFATPGTIDNCTTSCNYPGGLNRANQQGAGNTAQYNLMYSVAGTNEGNQNFTLYFKPEYFLLHANSSEDVSECFPVAPARRLLVADTYVVNSAASASVDFKVNSEAFGQLGLTAPSTAGDAYRIRIPMESSRFESGNNTITIRVMVNQNSANTNYTTSQQPATQQVVTTTINFWRQDAQANADFAFNNMCNTTTMTLNATNITPVPQPVYANNTLVTPAQTLFTPMITVWGKKTLNIDGTIPTNQYDAAATKLVSFANKYYIMNPAQTNGTLSLVVSADTLAEGTYTMNAAVSLVSDKQFLIEGLQGVTQIVQADNSNINNKYESEKRLETVIKVGVQRTPTYLSAISSPTTGALQTGNSIVLTWSFKGIGMATCTHDGVLVSANCVSPVTITANDVSNAAKHDFTVTFTDICGNLKTAKFEYSAQGVSAVTKVDMPATTGDLGTGNAAAPSLVSSLATLSMGAAAFGLMSLAL